MREILKVLIIDDTDSDRLSVRRSLRHAGFDVDIVEVSDGRTAVETLRQQNFDVAFLDFKLPDGDGLDVLKEARQAGVKTPIIAFTAFGNEDVAVELMKAGATDYLSKNRCSADTVKQCVQRAMALRQLQREKEQALRALVNSEKLTRSVINSLPQFVIVVDRSGNIINVNDACESRVVSAFSLPQGTTLHGMNIDLLLEQAPKPCRKELNAALKAAQSVLRGTRKLAEKELICPPDLNMMMRVTPLVRESGGAVIVLVDISDQKALEQQVSDCRNHQRHLYDAAGDAICTVDADGKIGYANSAFAAMAGSTGAGLSGRTVADLVIGKGRDSLNAALVAAKARGSAKTVFEIGTAKAAHPVEAICVSSGDGPTGTIDILLRKA